MEYHEIIVTDSEDGYKQVLVVLQSFQVELLYYFQGTEHPMLIIHVNPNNEYKWGFVLVSLQIYAKIAFMRRIRNALGKHEAQTFSYFMLKPGN